MPKLHTLLAETVHGQSIDPNAQALMATPSKGSVIAGSASVHIANNHIRSASCITSDKNETDDAANIMFIEGLPSVAVADGALLSLAQPIQQICNDRLPLIAPGYVARLSNGEDPEAIMQDLLKSVEAKASSLKPGPHHNQGDIQFTFACTLTYEHQGQLKAATIGSGSDLIVVWRTAKNRYETLKPAVNLCHPDEAEAITARNLKVPQKKHFLPLDRADAAHETFDHIFASHPVTVVDLNPDDQIVALTDGAFEFLPLQLTITARDENTSVIYRTFPADFNTPPAKLVTANLNGRDVAIANAGEHYKMGDDSAIAIATIPTSELREAIVAKTQQDHQLAAQQGEVLARQLERQYWGSRLTGQRHLARRDSVCASLRQGSLAEHAAILYNQEAVCRGYTRAQTMIDEGTLDSRWSSATAVRNPINPERSAYYQAIKDLADLIKENPIYEAVK